MMPAILASKYSISGPFLSMTSNVEKEKKKHSISSKKTIPLALSQNALVSVSATGGTVMNNQTMTLASNSVTVIIALVSCAFAGDIIEKKTKIGRYLGNALSALVLACFLASFTHVFSFSTNATMVVFDLIWDMLMPLGVALALLNVKVSDFATKSNEVLFGFLFASIGSILGLSLIHI